MRFHRIKSDIQKIGDLLAGKPVSDQIGNILPHRLDPVGCDREIEELDPGGISDGVQNR